MRLGVLEVVRIAQGGDQFDAAVLVGEDFRMLERQEEEHPQRRIDAMVVAGGDRARRVRPRQRVGRERMAAVAEHVARDLVEQQHQRERAVGVIEQRLVLAPRRGEMRVEEAVAQRGVEGGVLGEPFRRTGVVPKGDDVVGRCHAVQHSHGCTRKTFGARGLSQPAVQT